MKRILYFILLISNFTYSQVKNRPDHDPPAVVNVYTEVLAFNICTNEITVADATFYNPGDTVLIIQMKGAVIDTSNTASFGTILDYKNAGNYEFNYISQKSGNVLIFKNKLTRTYDIPDGVVQLIRVPKIEDASFSGGLTCDPWDGYKGGVLAFTSTTRITSNEDIDVSGLGFRGGEGYNAVLPSSNCTQNGFNYPVSSELAAFKGESIATVSQNLIKGKGSPAGGGGGGISHNSGGGGGGNGGSGGSGGYQSDSCSNAPFDNRGLGGKNLLYTTPVNRIFMGGGGGAGHADNTPFETPSGGAGGGIIIIIADSLDLAGFQILSNGRDGRTCVSPNCNDGMGGGGAGGTILLSINQIIDSVSIETKGGNGANMTGAIIPGGRVGPGGGGAGGMFSISNSSLPSNITYSGTGGINGVVTMDANNAWGATSGSPGLNLFNLVIPFDTILFVPNIDSVRIQDSVLFCNNVQFKGFGFTNSYPVTTWQWDFGDGAAANTQNTSHSYPAVGTYNVKLIITDINGCKDSISTTVNTAGPMFADAGTDTTICTGGQVSLTLNGSGTGFYSWSPAAVLNDNTLQNPIATINTTTKFYLIVSNGTGCLANDSVTVTVNQNPVVKTLADTSICKNAALVLTTNGAANYNWSPGIYVSDSTIASPQYIDSVSHTLIVTGTGSNGCRAGDTINVDVKSPVIFLAPQGKTICIGESVQLNGNNGNTFQYLWSPPFYLSNPNIKNPVANPPVTTTYSVTITDNTCNYDSTFAVNVIVLPLPLVNATKSNNINCNKPFAQLNVSGTSNYTWTPAFTLSNSSIANPIANPVTSTTYFVTATDNNGCVNIDSITLIVNFGNNGILLPNSFTPNRDGINDCFGIRYYRDVQNLVFIIYNRYGVKIFETHNAAECWNGHYKGQPADPGSYVYFLKAKTLCGNVVKKGSVMLIR